MLFPDSFSARLTTLPGVGPKTARALASLGLRTLADLLLHLPRAYQDRRQQRAFHDSPREGKIFIRAVVTGIARVRMRRGGQLVRIGIEAGGQTGELLCFNRPYLAAAFRPGMQLAVYGSFAERGGRWQSSDFEYEPADDGATGLAFGRVVPVYPLTRGVSQTLLREAVFSLLPRLGELEEVLPVHLRNKRVPVFHGKTLSLGETFALIHFPPEPEAAEAARKNLAYLELFLYQTRLRRRHLLRSRFPRPRRYRTAGVRERAEAAFGFVLTAGQQLVLQEILADLDSPRPMQRLLLGDVGSGKTAVAAAAVLAAADSGFQVAVVAPTTVLAHQLYLRLSGYLGPLGIEVAFLTGKMPPEERRRVEQAFAAGGLQVAVGTHILFGESVVFRELGLVVIDEQHKFGVAQRRALRVKGAGVDCLAMSATPIPRTLALTLYGDLDISRLEGLPQGRIPVATFVESGEGGTAGRALVAALEAGGQGIVVYPLVEASEASDMAAATVARERLAASPLGAFGVGLLHGRMDEADKLQVMEAFREGRFGVLVATTIVEVGLDNPRATVMVINAAERFGLAQLHQIRGRVGRGSTPGACYLRPSPQAGPDALARLQFLAGEHDGFRIAREDLALRGQGDLLGRAQSGAPLFHAADIVRDGGLLETACGDAAAILERDPELVHESHRRLALLTEPGEEAD